jgi:hypothetical protein
LLFGCGGSGCCCCCGKAWANVNVRQCFCCYYNWWRRANPILLAQNQLSNYFNNYSWIYFCEFLFKLARRKLL